MWTMSVGCSGQPGGLGSGGMSALGMLMDRGLVASDWAQALAPVDADITRMGDFLRAEVAAGRGYLPHGDLVFRAFSPVSYTHLTLPTNREV